MTSQVSAAQKAGAVPKARDPRLDFFRGMAMFIIFIAHTPKDWWALWIPARFGFSDATEIFVFCSGMASAIAFGGVFARRGWWMGAARIAHRIWQVYWAHIGLFFAVLLLCIAFDKAGVFVSDNWDKSYVTALNLKHFMTKTPELVFGLFTLTYVPNYFDILPMYLAILALIPVVVGLYRLSPYAALALVVVLWAMANAKLVGLEPINFPAEPWTERGWFFNPFGWQLVFFTGFALMSGWIKPPPVNKRLIIIAAVIALVTIPIAYYRIRNGLPGVRDFYGDIRPWRSKTSFGILRYVHFLSLAYLAWAAVGPMGSRISNLGAAQVAVDVIRKVGQQSLAVFISSLVIAQCVGMLFRVFGNSWPMALLGNGIGFAGLVGIAYLVAWFKGQPWRGLPAEPGPVAVGAGTGAVTLAGHVPAQRAD
jgi:hypothetical protein